MSDDFQFDELFLSSSPQQPGIASKLDKGADSDTEDVENNDNNVPKADDEGPEEAAKAKCTSPLMKSIHISSNLTVNSFTLRNLVGKGAYGKVRLVIKNDTQEVFAMKTLRKKHLVKTGCVDNTIAEKDVLRKVRHPFIVRLHYAFQTPVKVYLIMDFVNGGHLLRALREVTVMTEKQARFYIAEVILAIEHLHSLNIIHRDLKPENVLIGADGHCVLTDFGFAKEEVVDLESCKSFCGTLEYMAPEVIKKNRYGKPADWWSVGILLYDMLCGRPPFQSKNDAELYEKIMNGQYNAPSFVTKVCRTLIAGMLRKDPTQRFTVEQIKEHAFFDDIDWDDLAAKEIRPPFMPDVENTTDISNFDKRLTKLAAGESPISSTPLSNSIQEKFMGFSYARSFEMAPR